jgi:hypothetical protein
MKHPVINKSVCHFPYYLRGNGLKHRKWALKHKTAFGLFLIKNNYVR